MIFGDVEGMVPAGAPAADYWVGAWGMELVLDLADCDPETIRSRRKIRRFGRALCAEIGMRPYRRPWTPLFALHDPDAAGHSFLQWLMTSSILGHVMRRREGVCVNVFSCKRFDPDAAAKFIADYFGGTITQFRVLPRGRAVSDQ